MVAERHDELMHIEPRASGGAYRALVVDDEVPLAQVVASYLEREHFEVGIAHNGVDALAIARESDPDVVVLDVGLPGIDGLEVCRQLRTFSDAYVVMLTARDSEMDTVIGLSIGADDYVTKPFSPRELMARVRAMLRRPRSKAAQATIDAALPVPKAEPRVFGALTIDVDGRQVFVSGAPVMLTRTEFDVLAALSSRPGNVFSRRQLLEAIWGDSWVGNEHLIDVHVGHLRRKLGDNPAHPRYVITVRGVGYRMGTGQWHDLAPPTFSRPRHAEFPASRCDFYWLRPCCSLQVPPLRRSWQRSSGHRCFVNTCTAPTFPMPPPSNSTLNRLTGTPRPYRWGHLGGCQPQGGAADAGTRQRGHDAGRVRRFVRV